MHHNNIYYGNIRRAGCLKKDIVILEDKNLLYYAYFLGWTDIQFQLYINLIHELHPAVILLFPNLATQTLISHLANHKR